MKTREILDALEDQDRVVDVSDRASQVEAENAMHLRHAHDRKMVREQEPKDGQYEHTDCVECGNEIDPRRLEVALKNMHCIHCATAMERNPFKRR